jgi:hypothetical protein
VIDKIITNWEASGNGAGQRSPRDKKFGRFSSDEAGVDSDNRASFVRCSVGHRVHHLYLWHLADKMGVLQNVLSILSPDVSSDGSVAHPTTQQVQQPCRKNNKEDEQEKKDRRAFCVAVGASLTSLAITSKEDSLRHKEDKVERFTVAAKEAEENNDERKRKYYQNLADHHASRVSEYEEEIVAMKENLVNMTEEMEDINFGRKLKK